MNTKGVNRIRGLRQARGWTQFALALKVGVYPPAVSFWETGRRTPQVAHLRTLGQVFGLCSDAIDLEPAPAVAAVPHRPHAARHPDAPALRRVPHGGR